MADGYVSQKRYLPPKSGNKHSVRPDGSAPPLLDRPYVRLTAGWDSPVAAADLRRYQETTSFRTGRPESEFSDPENYRRSLLEQGTRTTIDNGHTFDTMTRFALTSHPSTKKDFSNGAGFCGPLQWSGTTAAALPPEPDFDLAWYGNKAIAATAPTAPRANTLQTAAEIFREGITLPLKSTVDLIQGRTRNAVSAYGSEYLNLEFGWKPLVSEFHSVLNVVSNHAKLMEQLKRDSGRFVRRRWGFPISTTVDHSNTRSRLGLGGVPDLDSSYYQKMWKNPISGAGFSTSTVKQTQQSVWFSGQFTFYLNLGSTLQDKFEFYGKQADYLLGLKITPEVMWELTPWSWLTDYFVDVGSAVKAARLLSSDSLVLQYGYMMRKTSRNVTVSGITDEFFDGSRAVLSSSFHQNRKQRFRSTPYGFGLNPTGLSTRQWAILGALGMTKAPNKLF